MLNTGVADVNFETLRTGTSRKVKVPGHTGSHRLRFGKRVRGARVSFVLHVVNGVGEVRKEARKNITRLLHRELRRRDKEEVQQQSSETEVRGE